MKQIATEAEFMAATRQLSLLKESYAKARDTLRAEQSVRVVAVVESCMSNIQNIK